MFGLPVQKFRHIICQVGASFLITKFRGDPNDPIKRSKLQNLLRHFYRRDHAVSTVYISMESEPVNLDLETGTPLTTLFVDRYVRKEDVLDLELPGGEHRFFSTFLLAGATYPFTSDELGGVAALAESRGTSIPVEPPSGKHHLKAVQVGSFEKPIFHFDNHAAEIGRRVVFEAVKIKVPVSRCRFFSKFQGDELLVLPRGVGFDKLPSRFSLIGEVLTKSGIWR